MHPRIRPAALALIGAAALLVTAACGGAESSTPAAGGGSTSAASQASGSAGGSADNSPANLNVLFGSSGPAETDALNAATNAWGAESGSTVTVTPAEDLIQQLAQGFSSGQAPDVFYAGADQFANYAKAGNLLDYADSLSNADDF